MEKLCSLLSIKLSLIVLSPALAKKSLFQTCCPIKLNIDTETCFDSKDSNLKFMGESLNEKNEINGFVFIDKVEQLISVAEEQFKQQNIRVVKIIISNSVKKNLPICLRHGEDLGIEMPTIAYTNDEGQALPYEYNVVNLSNAPKRRRNEDYFYDETYKDTISDGEDEHYDNKYDKTSL